MYLQVTIIYLVDASECIPTAEEWPKVWEAQEKWRRDKQEAAKKLEVCPVLPLSN